MNIKQGNKTNYSDEKTFCLAWTVTPKVKPEKIRFIAPCIKCGPQKMYRWHFLRIYLPHLQFEWLR